MFLFLFPHFYHLSILGKMNDVSKTNGETVQVGSTGTIGSLMSRELQSMKNTKSTEVNSDRKTPSTSVPHGPHQKKVKHKAPMLCSESMRANKSTGQGNTVKKGSSFVEVVDLKCNNPMGNRLKKLGFSKLSDSVV